MSTQGEHLNKVGRDIVKAVNVAVAHEGPLRKQWRLQDAERARTALCKVLAISRNNRFWTELAEAIPNTADAVFAEELRKLDLESFYEFEVQILKSAGAHPAVAIEWAERTVLLVNTIRLGLGGELNAGLQADAAQAREWVSVAHRELCTRKPQLVPPGSRSGRFRKKLWGAIHAASGLGTMTLNGALLLGAPVSGGLTAVFGGSSLLGGYVQLLVGAERLLDSGDRDLSS